MKLIAVLLVIALAGCTHTPGGYNFTRDGGIPKEYKTDKSQCHDQAWASAKEEVGTTLNDVFVYLFDKNLVQCMNEKGYQKVNDSARVHYVSSNQEI